MKPRILIFLISTALFSAGLSAQPSDELRIIIEQLEHNKNLQIQSIPITAKNALKKFYYQNVFELAWSNEAKEKYLKILNRAPLEGMSPDHYYYNQLKDLLSYNKKAVMYQAEIDVLFSQSFMLYVSHLLHGKVDPVSIYPYWKVKTEERNVIDLLNVALKESKIASIIEEVVPNSLTYIVLKEQLELINNKSTSLDNWENIPLGISIKVQDDDSRIPAIVKKLMFWNYLNEGAQVEGEKYSSKLEEGVKAFQLRQGLIPDGIIGNKTVRALNYHPDDLKAKILVNMERCRWVQEELGNDYILVNIADYYLKLVQNNKEVLIKRAIVGKQYRQTPVFSSQMTYLVLNPYWFVPPTILREDMLPAIKKDPNYLQKLNIKIVKGAFGEVITSSSINWKEVKASNFPYTLRQDPGSSNALGIVKFMFPNDFNVYIHDTNKRELFAQEDRNLSSGCIRVLDPLELVERVLDDPTWTMDKIKSTIASSENYTVRLKSPIPVHIQYLTAYSDSQGVIQYRNDIYDRDPQVLKALMSNPDK